MLKSCGLFYSLTPGTHTQLLANADAGVLLCRTYTLSAAGDGQGTPMRAKTMTEPASTAFGGIALYKLGVLGAVGAVLVTIVVMAMTLPKTAREFVVAMICTVVSSIGGGAFVIRWFELRHWIHDDIGLIALAAIIFLCGLPAWVMVRSWFVYAELSKHMSLPDMLRELKAVVWK